MNSLSVEYLLGRIKQHFKIINNCKDLTDADKLQIKTFYLVQFASPDARQIVEDHLRAKSGLAATSQRPTAPPDRTPRDRH